jgi:NDP-sugar pyrophosphorylase family protein
MVLAAGLGTRLGRLSDELPKPLLPMVGYPILRYGFALLEAHGVTEACVNLHHKGDAIRAALDGRTGVKIRWSPEEKILGTGGGLARVADWLTFGGRQPFLVMNGKLVIDVDLGALLARHLSTGAAATMVVREVEDAERWGAIDLDGDDRVTRILGEPAGAPFVRRTMFCGVHVVSPELVARLPDGESDSIRHAYLPALRDGARISALRYDGYFAEHSTPARYLDGNLALVSGAARLRHPPGPLTGVQPGARVASSARLVEPLFVGAGALIEEGATVGPLAVIGEGATVAQAAEVVESVVWPGARASGPLRRAIVTQQGTLTE